MPFTQVPIIQTARTRPDTTKVREVHERGITDRSPGLSMLLHICRRASNAELRGDAKWRVSPSGEFYVHSR